MVKDQVKAMRKLLLLTSGVTLLFDTNTAFDLQYENDQKKWFMYKNL